MPLQMFSSLPDSTVSTSPQQATPPAVIKRSTRMYGRKKSPASGIDASSTYSHPADRSIFQTAPPGLQESVEPSSDNESDEPTAGHTLYSWQEKLKLMDEEDSEEEHDPNPRLAKARGSGISGFGVSSLLPAPEDDSTANHGPPSSVAGEPSIVDDLFNTTPPRTSPKSSRKRLQRATTPPLFLEAESDSGNEQPKTSPISKTPQFYLSNTPKSNSSTTPPTTDAEASASRSIKPKGRKRSLEELRQSIPLDTPPSLRNRRAFSDMRRQSKHKKPTKKDREEMIKESARMANQKSVSIQSHKAKKYTTETLLLSLRPADVVERPSVSKRLAQEPSFHSDPIVPFTSPDVSMASTAECGVPVAGPSKLEASELPPSDDELPVSILFQGKTQAEIAKAALLNEEKARLLQIPRQPDPDSDSDLEIVPAHAVSKPLGEDQPRSTERMSRTRKTQLRLARVGYPKSKVPTTSSEKAASAPSREQFENDLWDKVKKETKCVIKKKKQEWEAVGGRVLEQTTVENGPEAVLQAIIDKGLQAVKEREAMEGSEESDGDWEPEQHGSASPEPDAMDVVEEEEEEDQVSAASDLDEGLGDKNNIRVPRGHRRQMILDSDEENDESDENSFSKPKQLSSPDENPLRLEVGHNDLTPFSEDGTDKENNDALVFDRSEDKENKAVVRFGSSDSFENLLTNRLPDSLSSSQSSQSRKPFQELPGVTETLKPRDLGRANLTQLFEAQLSEPRRTPELQLSPFLGSKDSGGFSQFSQEENTLVGQQSSQEKSKLADLFDAATQVTATGSPNRGGLLEEAFGEEPIKPIRGLARNSTLDLTQDLLQPAFQPKEGILRKANDILEKEQEFVLDAAFHTEGKKPELYVNEDGFLTQTRPDVPNPEVYQPPSPLQSQQTTLLTPLESRSGRRSPLATISLSDPTQADSPIGQLNRLRRKRSESPSDRAAEVKEKKLRNAFDLLGQGVRDEADRKRRRLEKSEFVAEEAFESDDEGDFWGGKRKNADDDEEMEGEDLDKALEGLVDDQEMDEETLAEDRVAEKFREDEELRDKRIEESANNVVQGEWRKRFKDGGFMKDESDDEMDDDGKRARRKLRKQNRIRDDVEALDANPLTKSFAAVYKATLNDDDENDFAHMTQDHTEEVLFSLSAAETSGDDEDGDDGDAPGVVTSAEILQQVRARANNRELVQEDRIDVTDTSWINQEDDEDAEMEVLVKTIKPAAKKMIRARQGLDPSDMDDGLESQEIHVRPADDPQLQRAQTWAKRQGQTRNISTARAGSSAAVSNLQTRAGGGSLRHRVQNKSDSTAETSKPVVKKAASMLVAVDRSARFS